MFIFPGLGLGATVCGAKRVSRGMIYATSETLATSLTEEEKQAGQVFPSIHRIREISLRVATAVVRAAHEEDLINPQKIPRHVSNDSDLVFEYVQGKMYDPVYVPLVDMIYSSRHS